MEILVGGLPPSLWPSYLLTSAPFRFLPGPMPTAAVPAQNVGTTAAASVIGSEADERT